MTKVGKLVLWIAGICLGLMLITGLAAKALLSGRGMDIVLDSLRSRLPVTVEAGGGSFSLSDWFLFRPSIAIRDLSIGNPEGFSGRPMIETQQVSAQVALLSLFRDQVEVRRFRLLQPQLNVERDSAGRANVAVLLAAAAPEAAPPEAAPAEQRELTVNSFVIDSGTVRYFDAAKQEPSLTLRDLDLTLADFGPDKSCRMELSALLFESESSRLDFKGRAGPFRPESAPAQGDLSIHLAPAEIPERLRAEYFGDLLKDPGGASHAMLQASMKGDLVEALRGDGELALSGFHLGRDSKNRIAVGGKAPLKVTVARPLSDLSLEISTEKASLQLGQGSWTGRAGVRLAGSRLAGSSSGAITGVRIEELLGAFSSQSGAVSGRAAIPEYRLRFDGSNARELQESLAGQGKINLEEGRIALFDLIGTVQKTLQELRTGQSPAAGSTEFARLMSGVEIRDRRVLLSEMVLESPLAGVTGSGHFTFDGALDFDAVVAIPERNLRVPVKIRGTTESPKVYPDVGRIAKEKAMGFLESLLKKKTGSP